MDAELQSRTFRGVVSAPDGIQVLAAPGLGNAEQLALGVAVLAPGAGGALDRHAAEEAVVVLEGSCRLAVGGGVVELAAGDALVIAPDAEHRVEQAGGEGAKLLWVYAPPGPESRFLP